jgi:hypothetical protein
MDRRAFIKTSTFGLGALAAFFGLREAQAAPTIRYGRQSLEDFDWSFTETHNLGDVQFEMYELARTVGAREFLLKAFLLRFTDTNNGPWMDVQPIYRKLAYFDAWLMKNDLRTALQHESNVFIQDVREGVLPWQLWAPNPNGIKQGVLIDQRVF